MRHDISGRSPARSEDPGSHRLFVIVMHRDGVLGLRGELDADTAPLLTRALQANLAHGDLTVDLSGLSFCGCGGLSALLVEHQRRQRVGSRLVLANPTRQMRRVLSLTGLDAILTIGGLPPEPAAQRRLSRMPTRPPPGRAMASMARGGREPTIAAPPRSRRQRPVRTVDRPAAAGQPQISGALRAVLAGCTAGDARPGRHHAST